jgi:GNAT superfamily N-acetyltransferase
MNYRKAEISDYQSIAETHLKSFNNFFLTSLGKRFLEVFYRSCLKSREAVVVVGYDTNGKLSGFALGTINTRGFYRRILFSNFFTFSIEAVRLALTKPFSVIRLARNLSKNGYSPGHENCSELLSIATLPEVAGKGIGKKLLENFECEVRKSGIEINTLTTDYYNNSEALGFYLKSGYKIENDFISYPDRRMNRLSKKL